MTNATFYKYRADSTFTEQIIKSRKVYLSTAEGLNDPFECTLQDIGREQIEQKILEMKQAAVLGFVMQAQRSIKDDTPFFGLNSAETKKMLQGIKDMQDVSRAFLLRDTVIKRFTGYSPSNPDILFAQINQQLLDVGIFSLSANPSHQLMWAHYGAEHAGICLGFSKTPESKLSNPEHFLPVIYSDKLPEMKDGLNVQMTFSVGENGALYTSSYKVAFSDKTFQKAITTKPTCWSYEEEWRYVEPYPGLFAWPGPLTEVTFGLKCLPERRAYYINLVEENIPYQVNFFEMRKKRGTNELERLPYEIPISNPKISTFPDEKIFDGRREMTMEEFAAEMERLTRKGNYGDVIFQVEENLRNNPDDANLLSLKGVAHGMAQEHNKALECFVKITNKYPDDALGWYQMACALIALGQHNEAVNILRKAYSLNPNDPSIALNLGIELFNTKASVDEALKYLKLAERLGHRRAHNVIEELQRLNK